MTDWGSVPAWLGSIAGVLSAGAAATALIYAQRAAKRIFDRERQRLANGVLGAVANGDVTIMNYSDEVVTSLRVYFLSGSDPIECPMNADFVAPKDRAYGPIPEAANTLGRGALVFEFRDSRGDSWLRQWDRTERLPNA